MSDDDETHLQVTYASHLDMDDAFCASMRIAIAAGLECAPMGLSPRLEPKPLDTFQQSLGR